MQKLPKCLIFCKLHYITYHQRFCRYCGITQKAPGAQDFLLSEISVESAQDSLVNEIQYKTAGSSQSTGWWKSTADQRLLNRYFSRTSAPLASLQASRLQLKQNMRSSVLQPGKGCL